MAATRTPHFRLLGFPVHVGYGFVMFMVLIAVMPRGDGGGQFGLWLAGSVAAFTLIHELGHALVARHVGAEAGISLEFMAGYTSFRPTRPISRPWSVAISLAGPAVHIATSVAVLVAMGVNPLDHDSVLESHATQAIWWAGPFIGLMNLVPVLPLDGGNVVMTAIDGVAPGKGRPIMVWVSLVITGAALASAAFVDETRRFVVFIGILFALQLAAVFDERSRNAVSPFDAAAKAMRNGDEAKAVRILSRGLSRPTPRRLVPTELSAPSDLALEHVISRLPRPLPAGDPWNEYLLATFLTRFGRANEAAEYAAASFHDEPSALAASAVARAAASLGDSATAAGWLRAARDAGLADTDLRALVTASREFATVRDSPEFQELLGGPTGSPTAEPRRT
ncbi:hypothetical protein [Desertimonas flava]|uniref:hypothetical protein n=1 Tax=Desertimonas flava TaxID=2064846 RepID=UPI000E3500C3|nr:hypothetical protein [Desertimonas flava]